MTLLDVAGVSFAYGRTSPVLKDVSLQVAAGQSVGLVGESGSGKSTLLRLILGVLRPTLGTIRFDGVLLDPGNGAQMRSFRRQVQVVFQDPFSSLDPRQAVFDCVAEPLRSLKIEGDHRALVTAALESVGLPADSARRYPHEFSGGQRQRIAIARAIVARPRLLLADEAASALDLSTRLRIIELFKSLALDMTLLFVTHDLGVVAAVCDSMAVLEAGRIVETGATAHLLRAPTHPYTQRLLASVPRLPDYAAKD